MAAPASNQRGWLVYTRAIDLAMTHCDKRDLDACETHFAIGVSILLLALAVFGWGLHSKLSLYHARTNASQTAPIAKLLSERERPTDTTHSGNVNHTDLHAVALASTIVLLSLPAQDVRAIWPRRDVPPAASRTLACKGPSLRRPPPSLVA
jgi:hypothetical protein